MESSVLHQIDRLCTVCKGIDFLSLLAVPSSTTVVNGFDLSETRANISCPFCRLVARCTILAEPDLNLSVQLMLRARMTPSYASNTSPSPSASMLGSQIYLDFVSTKSNLKRWRPQPDPGKKTQTASDDDEDIMLQAVVAASLQKDHLKHPDGSPPLNSNLRAIPATGHEPDFSATWSGQSPSHTPALLMEPSHSNGEGSESEEDSDLQYAIEMSLRPDRIQTIAPRSNILHDEAAFQPSSTRSTKLPAGEDVKLVVDASWVVDIIRGLGCGKSVPCRTPVQETTDRDLTRGWLHTCQKDHHHPAQVAGIAVPLAELPLKKHLRVMNTTTGRVTALDPYQKFVALSYVWGQDVTASNLYEIASTNGQHAGLDLLPATIRDAAEVSRTLGFNWLWVDRVCIDQHDPNEKAFLLAYMKDIYAAAELTIVAAGSDTVYSGLPGISRLSREAEPTFTVPVASDKLELVPTPASFNAMLQVSTWHTRAWTFEEHIFSRRLLYFFPSEILFSCAEGFFRESTGSSFTKGGAGTTWGDRGRIPPTIGTQLHAKIHTTSNVRITAREYIRAVEEYSSRQLTLEEDRIDAFAGIVAAASPEEDITGYGGLLLHGHPTHFFETLLTWHHDETPSSRVSQDTLSYAPSWSWAAAGAKIHFLDDGEEHTRNRWFRFSQIGKFDVLGIPVERDIPLLSGRSLAFPDEIIAESPWTLRIDAQPLTSGGEARRLPVLHILTVVFDGLLIPLAEGQHCLRSVGSDPDTKARLIGPWSVSWGETGADKRGISPMKFALVGGDQHMYIMLLSPGEDEFTFRRRGLCRMGLYGSSSSYLSSIMTKGGARWDYICLA